MILWTFWYITFGIYINASVLCIYLRMELLGCGEYICLAFVDNCKTVFRSSCAVLRSC